MTATFNLLDADGNVLRTVRGAGTAVILRNAGECASFEAAERITWRHIEKAKEYAADLNEMFAMGEPVADSPLPVETIDYSSLKLGDLRKLASQRGMRSATGIDPYKQATRSQLVDFVKAVNA